jgi:hypothetical protein
VFYFLNKVSPWTLHRIALDSLEQGTEPMAHIDKGSFPHTHPLGRRLTPLSVCVHFLQEALTPLILPSLSSWRGAVNSPCQAYVSDFWGLWSVLVLSQTSHIFLRVLGFELRALYLLGRYSSWPFLF